MNMHTRSDLWVWMDVEMTSLADVNTDQIIQVATVITDKELNIVAEGPEITIHADRSAFDRITPEVKALHEKSGVLEASVASVVTLAEAEKELFSFISEHAEAGTAPLCGNSVHMDRMFLKAQMPTVYDHLFYRNIDVSTLKELARRWKPELYDEWQNMKGEKAHRAKEDILRSIEELKYYRTKLLSL
ncbi:oligoribonuclease [Patescibacteria group bacterium]|nr:oligoribonuclease [Patescibacteria group bacterium]